MRLLQIVLGCLLIAAGEFVQAAPLPISAFAGRPQIREVYISPDGRYLLYTTTRDGNPTVVTLDRRSSSKPRPTLNAGDDAEVSWCRWVTAARFICALRAVPRRHSQHPESRTRLAAVGADGSDAKIIFEYASPHDQLEDQITNLRADEEGWVQVQTFWSTVVRLGTMRSDYLPRSEVIRLNVNSGDRERIALTNRTMPPFVDLISDLTGQVLIANGIAGSDRVYWVRLSDRSQWQELFRHDTVEPPVQPIPFAVVPGTQEAYAIGRGARHQALFRIDLSGSTEHKLIFESGDADVTEPVFAGNGDLLGTRLDTQWPRVHYLNARDRSVVAAIDRLLPDSFNEIVDVTPNRHVYVIRSSSDVNPGVYYLLDTKNGNGELAKIDAAFPELDPATLPKLRNIAIESAGARTTRGFVSTPLDAAQGPLPLVVMPDDGPYGRTDWRYSFLRHFLLSRGYAVLQLQLDETSDVRNRATLRRALDDAAYSALETSVQWAIEQGIADPKRIAILGWGFGGYLALLGSQRNPDLFRCAVGINAITDLSEQPGNHSIEDMIADFQRGPYRRSTRTPPTKTPAPLLLIHGSDDTEVHPHQARYTAAELALGGAPYERIEIDSGTHEMSNPAARARMLEIVEDFLAVQLVAK